MSMGLLRGPEGIGGEGGANGSLLRLYLKAEADTSVRFVML